MAPAPWRFALPDLAARTALSSRSRRALVSWAALAAAGLAVLAVTWSGAAGAQDGAVAGDVRRGEQLYTANCSWCHSPDGRGGIVPATGDPAPAIDDVSIAYARLVMITGRMPPGGDPFDNRNRGRTLPHDEQEDILAFMVERFGLEGDVGEPELGDAARGLEVYAQNCAQCHGASGEGGVAGAGAWTPRLVDYGPQTLADAIRVGPFAMPQFGPEQITDEEIGDIAAFIHEVREEPGAPLFAGELDPVYASAFAAGLVLVVVILTLLITGKPAMFPDPEETHEPVETGEEG